MLFGTVTAVGPLRVRVDGADSDTAASILGRGDSYAPVLDARVLLLLAGSRLFVVGEV